MEMNTTANCNEFMNLIPQTVDTQQNFSIRKAKSRPELIRTTVYSRKNNNTISPSQFLRYYLSLILVGISTFCSAQTELKASKKNVNGVILYSFIPDSKFAGYHCSLKTKILIDSITYDFVPENYVNYSIISKNKQLEKSLGLAESYLTGSFIAFTCVHRPNDKRVEKYDCDSAIDVFRVNNIYHPLLYKPDLEEIMALRIFSEGIYSKNHSDTIYIALQFSGTVIRYDDIEYGEQTDYRISKVDDDTEEFDDSHSLCPFKKYDSTLIILNQVKHLDKICSETQRQLKLLKSASTVIKIFLYE